MTANSGYLHQQLRNLWHNVLHGSQLLVFRPSAVQRLRIGMDEAVFLFVLSLLTSFIVNFVYFYPEVEFNLHGYATAATAFLGTVLVSFVFARFLADNDAAFRFFIANYSTVPVIYTAWLFVPAGFYYYYLGWSILVDVFIIVLLLEKNLGKRVLALGSYAVLMLLPFFYINSGGFWYEEYDDSEYTSIYKKVNQEDTYYRQVNLIQQLKQKLLPERKGVTDMYFVGFAGYGSENVFMNEVHYIQDLMDRRFDTEGRSVALINNMSTMGDTPLASRTNLKLVLNHLGKLMNPDEDVLFLYLTSHGSKNRLAVRFWPLRLNEMSANDLKQALDESGIKWRVLVVSACYSGSLIAPLQDEHSLILTAAAHDRTSFGCGSTSKYTYFGRAIFIEQLNISRDFIGSFRRARNSILNREQLDKLTSSNPQMFIGSQVRDKLQTLQQELSQRYTGLQAVSALPVSETTENMREN
jgi:hypothetical protein